MHPHRSRKGFVLVTAILAVMILMALGYLALTVSTGDLRISGRTVGEKKAVSAAEAGVHRLMQGLTPPDLTTLQLEGVAQTVGVAQQVDPATDPASRYTISNLVRSTGLPPWTPPGFSLDWGQPRYAGRVTGTNTDYGSTVQVDVGMGSGFARAGSTEYQ
jgi:hypothetical protein